MVEVYADSLSLQFPQHIWRSQAKHLLAGEIEEWKMTKTKINTINTFERGAGGSMWSGEA